MITATQRQDVMGRTGRTVLDFSNRRAARKDNFPWSKLGFGYGLNPDGDNAAEIVIYAGELHHGARAIIEVAETKKVITVDQQYIWVEYVLGSGAATIAGPSTTRPVSTAADSTFREWLFLFGLADGTASMDAIGHMGNIVLLGNFA